MSVAPGRTLVAWLGTLAPATIIFVGCGLPPDRLVMLQRALVVSATIVVVFGASHLIDSRWGDLYASLRPLPGVLVGTFADRNATALFLDACLLFLIGLPQVPRGHGRVALHVGAGVLLTVGVVLTGSRTGIVLLSAPALLFVWRAAAHLSAGEASGRRIVWLVAGALVAVLLAIAIASSGRGQASLSRFDGDDGMRAEMREDARFAAGRYWPVGAGMGTFDEVFQIDESLEYVSPRKAGRAHMDYLELAIEAGAAGLLLLAAWLSWAGWSAWRALRRRDAWPARAAALTVAIIAAQSLLEFPLRNQAMLAVAAFAVVLLARSPVASPMDREP